MVRLPRLLALLVCLIGAASPTLAQTSADSFAQLRIRPGRTIFVIDRQGKETPGFLRRLTPVALVMVTGGRELEIPSTSVARIETRDAVWPSAIVGGGIGALLGAGVGQLDCGADCASSAAAGAAVIGGIGAAIGAIADGTIKGRKVLYRSSSTVIVPGDSPTPFANLSATVKQGDMIQVIDPAGRKTKGKLQDISSGSILVLVDGQPRDISASDVQRIVKQHDRLWNGFAIGAAIGLLGGANACGSSDDCGAAVAATSLFYGVLGAGVDALMGRGQIAYVSASDPKARISRVNFAVSGVLTPRRKAVGISLGF